MLAGIQSRPEEAIAALTQAELKKAIFLLHYS
jgi:hypothetical protein